MREWTRWTAALAWGEALTDWSWSQDSDVDWESDDRALIMVLLAIAIGDASVECALVTPLNLADVDAGHDRAHPDEFGPIPLAVVRDYVADIEQAKSLVSLRSSFIGPYGGQTGSPDYSWLVRIKDSDLPRWRTVHAGVVQVLDRHISDSPTSSPVLADRKPALAEMERANLQAQFDEVLGEDF